MCCHSVQKFFDDCGEFITCLGIKYVSFITAVIVWIIFVIKLYAAKNLDSDSLNIVLNGKDEFLITTSDYPQHYENCHVFDSFIKADTALSSLQGLLQFLKVIGIIWAILQFFLLSFVFLEATKKLLKLAESHQTTAQLYMGCFKLILTTYCNSIFTLINEMKYDSSCILDYPTFGKFSANELVRVTCGLMINCFIGNIGCWCNNENPMFCFTYSLQLLGCCCSSCKRQPGKALSIIFHFIGFLMMLFCFVSLIIQLQNKIYIIIPAIISVGTDIVHLSKLYYKLKKNDFKPIKIEKKKYQQTAKVYTQDTQE